MIARPEAEADKKIGELADKLIGLGIISAKLF
jgi:hypothetical protein